MKRVVLGLALLGCGWLGPGQAATLDVQGDFSVHDPSTVVKCQNEYWFFATGRGLKSRHSRDLLNWEEGPPVFSRPPAWTTNAVPGNNGFFWAPDVVSSRGRYLLYYSVSTWGSQRSAIGLASNRTLDPSDSQFAWVDHGPVVQSSPSENFNAIDPALMLDNDGKLWMVFGSFWSGIKLVELDPVTGLRADTHSPITALAWKREIEAAGLLRHGDYYYLFVNWGLCCRGTNSTYSIQVGRSRQVSGPYVDRAGLDMMQGGGSLLLGTSGNRIGPGHAAFFTQGGTNWISFHFYDGASRGRSRLGISELTWGKDLWPEAAPGPGRP